MSAQLVGRLPLRCIHLLILSAVFVADAVSAHAAEGAAPEPVAIAGIPVDFILFALTLLGVAVLHHRTLQVAVTGCAVIALYKMLFTGFKFGIGLAGFASHMIHEWVVLANLFCLLVGFALLSRHFEKSNVPEVVPAVLPSGWLGGFVLLAIIFVLSSFLDNIAAAMVGATMAKHVFGGRVHIGYLAAIVAASNAGGAGSVVGDTTTTMMWIDGISPLAVFDAYVAAAAALVVFGIPAALQQHSYQPIKHDSGSQAEIEWIRVSIVFVILAVAIAANVVANLRFPALLEQVPVIGLAVVVAIVATGMLRRPDWEILPETVKGTIFLLALVTCASMMPVEKLPPASWLSSLSLGFISAVFDNIPLTALALRQGGYDWSVLAYAVGFGGSMIWFGSSAGVAVSNIFPEARSVGRWLINGWHVAIAYVIGFFVMLALLGWNPDPPHKKRVDLDLGRFVTAERADPLAQRVTMPCSLSEKGPPGLTCAACHGETNFDPARVPGDPHWALAPASMAWEGTTLAQICTQLKDRNRNGGRSIGDILQHVTSDSLVKWGWNPGSGRTPAPGSHAEFVALLAAWAESGAHCPS